MKRLDDLELTGAGIRRQDDRVRYLGPHALELLGSADLKLVHAMAATSKTRNAACAAALHQSN